MSGIAGMVCADGSAPDARLLERMAARQAFRGPDGSRIWARQSAGFCFAFLRTGPAPQASVQPCSIDERTWLMGDVRLDAREDLRQRLEKHGEALSADAADEELILRAWRQWGEACLTDLLGDFCFVLWEEEAQRLWCVRDLLGARPFFYAQPGGRFYFSNTLDVLRLAPEISGDLDAHFIGDFLLQAWCPDADRTVFREIRRLPQGHVLEFSNGRSRIRRFKALPVEDPLQLKRPEAYVEGYLELLEHSVRDRLPLDTAGFLLSGGLDSSSVTAMATKIARSRPQRDPQTEWLRAFTVSYRPLFDDQEGERALRVAQHLGIPMESFSGACVLPFEGLDDGRFHTPEPTHELFFAMQRDHFRHIAARTRVVLSGDGGDDILTGQTWPYLVYLTRRRRWGTLVSAFGGYVLAHGRFPPLRGGFRTRLRKWLGHSDAIMDYPQWLDPSFEKELHLRERWRELQQMPQAIHPFHPAGYAGLSSGYWASVLELEDAGWTGAAVETRAPLLDFRILRFLLRVPPLPWCTDKELVRRAMRGWLPEEIRLRPKTPLQHDPLPLYVESGRWQPTPLPPAAKEIASYIDWNRLSATFAQTRGLNLWRELRPVSLLYWLKGVEIKPWIE